MEKKKVWSEYTITIDNYKMCNMYIGTTTRRGEKEKGRERVRKGGRDERKIHIVSEKIRAENQR